MMANIYISSDFGLQWNNISITPDELAEEISGISVVDEKLVFDMVRIFNIIDNEYIMDTDGSEHKIKDIASRVFRKARDRTWNIQSTV